MNENQTLLLVDDGESDRHLMRAAFKKAGFDIPLHELHNGEEAIAYLKGTGPYGDRDRFPLPTLMLTDLNMPMKSGFDVVAWLRGEPKLKRLPVVVLTASMRPEDVERAYDLGVNAFFVKPGTLDALTAMVRCLQSWMQTNRFASLE